MLYGKQTLSMGDFKFVFNSKQIQKKNAYNNAKMCHVLLVRRRTYEKRKQKIREVEI